MIEELRQESPEEGAQQNAENARTTQEARQEAQDEFRDWHDSPDLTQEDYGAKRTEIEAYWQEHVAMIVASVADGDRESVRAAMADLQNRPEWTFMGRGSVLSGPLRTIDGWSKSTGFTLDTPAQDKARELQQAFAAQFEQSFPEKLEKE